MHLHTLEGQSFVRDQGKVTSEEGQCPNHLVQLPKLIQEWKRNKRNK